MSDWDTAARATLHKSQLLLAHEIARLAGSKLGCHVDGLVVEVPGVTDEALTAAIAKFPVEVCAARHSAKLVGRIKREARRRIVLSGASWMVERAMLGGKAVPELVTTYAAAVREMSDALEKSLPDDPEDDRHWPRAVIEGVSVESSGRGPDPLKELDMQVTAQVAAMRAGDRLST